VTVVLSSHLLHEVQQVCTRAVIIDHGRVVVQGPVAELRPEGLAVKVMTDDQAKASQTARAMFGARAVGEDDGYLVVQAGDDVPELVRRLVADDLAVRSVVPATDQGLEDYFLELTARGMRPPERESPEPAEQGTPSREDAAGHHEAQSPEDTASSAEPESPEGTAPPEAAEPPADASLDEEESAPAIRGETPAPASEETPPVSGPRVTIAVERPGGTGRPESSVLRPARDAGEGSPVAPPPTDRLAPPPTDRAAPAPTDRTATAPTDRTATAPTEPIVSYRPAPGPTYRAAPPPSARAARSPSHGAMPVSVYRAAPSAPQGPSASGSSAPQSIDGRRR
jgi:hypothetical protein